MSNNNTTRVAYNPLMHNVPSYPPSNFYGDKSDHTSVEGLAQLGGESVAVPYTARMRQFAWCTVIEGVIALLLIITLVVLIALMFPVNHGKTGDPNCDDNNQCTVDLCFKNPDHCDYKPKKNHVGCQDACVVPDTGHCWLGNCTGECPGQCDSIFDFNPPDEECRPVVYTGVVSGAGLINFDICFAELCVNFLEWGPLIPWPCFGEDHGRYEFKKRGAKRCLDFISDSDPSKQCYESFTTCFMGTPICVFTDKCGRYRAIAESSNGGKSDPLSIDSGDRLSMALNVAMDEMGGLSMGQWAENKFEELKERRDGN